MVEWRELHDGRSPNDRKIHLRSSEYLRSLASRAKTRQVVMLGHLVVIPFSACQLFAHFSAEPLVVSPNGFDENIPDMHTFSVESHSSELFRKRSYVYKSSDRRGNR